MTTFVVFFFACRFEVPVQFVFIKAFTDVCSVQSVIKKIISGRGYKFFIVPSCQDMATEIVNRLPIPWLLFHAKSGNWQLMFVLWVFLYGR